MQVVSQWGSSMAPGFRGLIVQALQYLLVARHIIVLTLKGLLWAIKRRQLSGLHGGGVGEVHSRKTVLFWSPLQGAPLLHSRLLSGSDWIAL